MTVIIANFIQNDKNKNGLMYSILDVKIFEI